MPGDSIRELIFKNLKTTFQSIKGQPTYHNTVDDENVNIIHGTRAQQGYNEPYIYIYPNDEVFDPNKGEKGKFFKVLSVGIESWLRQDDDISLMNKTLNNWIADMEYALMVDASRGGYAIDTGIVSHTPFLESVNSPKCGVITQIDIYYLQNNNDPTSKTI